MLEVKDEGRVTIKHEGVFQGGKTLLYPGCDGVYINLYIFINWTSKEKRVNLLLKKKKWI